MTLTAANQVKLPSFMYGTAWKKDETAKLVKLAVEAGFRAIDTANQLKHYDEQLVGDALQTLYQQGVTRDSLFLQTKYTTIDGQDHRLPYDKNADLSTQVKQSMENSLEHLHTDYIDSYVLHGPHYMNRLIDADWEIWAAIESVYQEGKAKIIGVSNFSADQLRDLCAKAKVKPMVVQNRCYAAMGWDKEVRDICRKNQIIYQGFSLLTANGRVLENPTVRTIARRQMAGIAQVIFRFAMQIGMQPLTGTSNPVHMAEDLKSETFTLSDEDVRVIESIAVQRARF
ncbi:MAG TPA: aldo/keto reductase [Planktothrix sp.]|jgi:diketogulonate reductase-like aldo/keto reductase